MIRYPGSKDKIARQILQHFPERLTLQLFQRGEFDYREPFFGAGAVGLEVILHLPDHSRIWINDKDYGMACLWKSVHQDPEALIDKISRFIPSVEAFYRLKEQDGDTTIDPVECGFRKFALHRISFSGLGAKAGGPIGGRAQSSAFNVGCRWNPTQHCLDVRRNHALLRRFSSVKITSGDFEKLIVGAPPHAFIYVDPPYYEKGPELYKYSMSDDDHRRLASRLRECAAPWVLSYDDHPFVRDLYPWANVSDIALTYTTAVARNKRRKNSEIIITPTAGAAANRGAA